MDRCSSSPPGQHLGVGRGFGWRLALVAVLVLGAGRAAAHGPLALRLDEHVAASLGRLTEVEGRIEHLRRMAPRRLRHCAQARRAPPRRADGDQPRQPRVPPAPAPLLAAMMDGPLSATLHRVREIGRGRVPGHPLLDDPEQAEAARRILPEQAGGGSGR